MSPSDLLAICGAAFLGVFILLAVLASIMRLIIAAFPARQALTDMAVLAAITTAIRSVYPGSTITKVEEEK
jgi:hypothetical protein